MWSAHKFIRWFAPEKQLKTLALSLLIYYALMLKELIWVVFVNVSQYKFEDLWNIAVAPFAGAWIEILTVHSFCRLRMSLPSRERGLKFSLTDTAVMNSLSLPSRERGLKSVNRFAMVSESPVAPFAGAWIEILPRLYPWIRSSVAPFAGAWIEMSQYTLRTPASTCRSLRGSVDWNLISLSPGRSSGGRSLRGSVDWNTGQ